jgi:hypothetical protein
MAMKKEYSNIGCYISLNLQFDELQTNSVFMIDSGAQTFGILPYTHVPQRIKQNLKLGRKMAGISGDLLPVAGSINLLVNLGEITKEINFLVMKPSFKMTYPIIGFQFIVEFGLVINFKENTVFIGEKEINSQFVETDENFDPSTVEKINAVLNELNPEIMQNKLKLACNKIAQVRKWINESNFEKTTDASNSCYEDEFIRENTIGSIKTMFKQLSKNKLNPNAKDESCRVCNDSEGQGNRVVTAVAKAEGQDTWPRLDTLRGNNQGLFSSDLANSTENKETVFAKFKGLGPQTKNAHSGNVNCNRVSGRNDALCESLEHTRCVSTAVRQEVTCELDELRGINRGFIPSRLASGRKGKTENRDPSGNERLDAQKLSSTETKKFKLEVELIPSENSKEVENKFARQNCCAPKNKVMSKRRKKKIPKGQKDHSGVVKMPSNSETDNQNKIRSPPSERKTENSNSKTESSETKIHNPPKWLSETERSSSSCESISYSDMEGRSEKSCQLSISDHSEIDEIEEKLKLEAKMNEQSEIRNKLMNQISKNISNIKLNNESIDMPSSRLNPSILTDSLIEFKRFRCDECRDKESIKEDSTLSLSSFYSIKTIKLKAKTAHPIDVYLKPQEGEHLHVSDRFIVPEQEVITNAVMTHDLSTEVRIGNKARILLTNFSNEPIEIKQNTELGKMIRVARDFPKPELPILNKSYNTNKPQLDTRARIEYIMSKVSLTHLEEQWRDEIEELIIKYNECFYCEESDYGVVPNYEYDIKLKDNVNSSYTHQFRLPRADVQAMGELVDDMLMKGQISELKNDYDFNSPVFLLTKYLPDGTRKLRFLFDGRAINKLICVNSDNFHHDLVPETMYTLANKDIYTTLDASSAFLYIKISENSKRIVAFSFKNKRYCFNVLMFGLKPSPAGWQTVFSTLLEPLLKEGNTSYYMDDVIVATQQNHSKHISTLNSLFEILQENKLRISCDKFMPLHTQVKYLGYIISNEGIEIAPEKISAILRLAPPNNIKELQSLLGVLNYFSNFLSNGGPYLNTLSDMLKCKKPPLIWTHDRLHAFKELIRQLTIPPILQFPNLHETPILYTDSSLRYIAAVLAFDRNGVICPLGYFAKKIKTSHKYHSIMSLELQALCIALKHFIYLIPHRKIIWWTDNLNICRKLKLENNSRIAKLALFASTFEIEVHHLTSQQNFFADYLSRAGRIPIEELHSAYDKQEEQTRQVKQSLQLINPTDADARQCTPYIDAAEILEQQHSDAYCVRVRGALAEKPELFATYKVSAQGLLYICDDIKPDRLVLPRKALYNVIFLYHNMPMSGHTSAERLYLQLAHKYFYVGLKGEVEKVVKECQICQRVKRSAVRHSKYNIVRHPSAPNMQISTDICLVGRLKSKNAYIGFIVIVDYFSLYVYAQPI